MAPLTQCKVAAETVNDEKGFMSRQQADPDNGQNTHASIYLRPWQLKRNLDQFGCVAEVNSGNKTIATCERRLLVLSQRSESLRYFLCTHSRSKHTRHTYLRELERDATEADWSTKCA